MNLKKNIFAPFPYTRGFITETVSVLKVCLFTTLILFFLKPFGLDKVSSFVILGFGLVVFISAIFNITFFLYVFKRFINEDKWCVWKEIIKISAYLSTNILAIILFSITKFDLYLNLLTVIKFTGLTILFAIIPISMRVISIKNFLLKNKLKEAQLTTKITTDIISNDDIKSIELKSNIVNDIIKTNSRDLLFIEAEQNYITVIERKKNNTQESRLIRLSMKKALEQIDNNNIIRCHRSYIVNLKAVKSIKGNSQEMKLILNEKLKPIPVSRTYKKIIHERLTTIK